MTTSQTRAKLDGGRLRPTLSSVAVVAAASLVMLTLISGCGLLSRQQQNRIYSLERIAPAAPLITVAGSPIGIDVVQLPPGLDRRDIVVRGEDQRLVVRESDQWSSLLEPLVLHTLAFDLAARLPGGMVILPGQPIPNGARRSIDVMFEELTAGPGNTLTLDARWNLRATGDPVSSHHERITVDLTSTESAEVANGMSRALAELSDRMVAAIAR